MKISFIVMLQTVRFFNQTELIIGNIQTKLNAK